MKLNLGCGGDYKKGYLNIDGFDFTVADKLMKAYNLEYEENFFDEIYMSQLIEHLGIVGSIHCLSECFRILKPDKKLVIETPDLKKSFEKYLKGGREARKNILPWIYGVDMPGMVHRFCFPDDLLREILQKIGFVEIKKENFKMDQYEPVLKMTCKKPKEYKQFQFIAVFRKKLLNKDIIDLNDQITSLEKHDLIDFFSKKLKYFYEEKGIDIIDKIIFYGALKSPKITRIFLEESKSESIIKDDLFKRYLGVLKILEELDFTNILLLTMMKIQGFVGQQEKLYETINKMGLTLVQKILNNDSKKLTIDKLKEISKTILPNDRLEFFSDKLIKLKSQRYYQMAIKEFSLKNYKKSVTLFIKSIGLNRYHLLAYWNLGRLMELQEKSIQAKSYYKNALKVLNSLNLINKKPLKLLLEKEIKNKNCRKNLEPITMIN